MKFVNAISIPYAKVESLRKNDEETLVLSMYGPLRTVSYREMEKDKYYLSDFTIITELTFLGTMLVEEKQNNVLEQGKTVEIVLRLTRNDIDPKKRLYIDLDEFEIDLSKEKNKLEGLYEFYNYTRMTQVKGYENWLPMVDGKPLTGSYNIKVLIREKGQEEYTVQSITPLNFEISSSI